MSLTLTSAEKASISVAFDDGNGHVSELGNQFHFQFNPADFAHLEAEADGLFVVADAVGSASLHITTMDGTVQTDVDITVTEIVSNPSGTPTLVVTFGAPQPK